MRKKGDVQAERPRRGAQARFAALVGETEKARGALEVGAISQRTPHDLRNRLAGAVFTAPQANGDDWGWCQP